MWGAIWKLAGSDAASLDEQEGVGNPAGGYSRVEVFVSRASVEEGADPQLLCRSYQLKRDSGPQLPSPAYKRVILSGARELRLPPDYVAKLEAVETNGYSGPIGVSLTAIGLSSDDEADN